MGKAIGATSNDESVTQADRLAEAIAESVLSGEFAPGLRLDEGMLADRYGVSRTPVREAMRQLASTGLIELKPRRGARVATATSAPARSIVRRDGGDRGDLRAAGGDEQTP